MTKKLQVFKKAFASLIILFVSGSIAAPFEQWNKTFGEKGDDSANSVIQTIDGGFLVAGRSSSKSFRYDAYLIKTDPDGNLQWSKRFGGNLQNIFKSISKTSDGDYIIAGITNSARYADNTDAWLVKIDTNGSMIWNKTFGGEFDDIANSVIQTSDGGYVLAGAYGRDVNPFKYSWLIKTDAKGNLSWDKKFDNGEFKSIQQTKDGGFIVAGFKSKIKAFVETDPLIIKTDANGKLLWSKTFEKEREDSFNFVQQTSDGGYIFSGYTDSMEKGKYAAWFYKTDEKGNEQWSKIKSFGESWDDRSFSVEQTFDGGYLFTGYTESIMKKRDVWLVKTDINGIEQWNKIIGGLSEDQVFSLQQTSDMGFILAGSTYSYGNGSSDAWLIKVSSDSDITPVISPTSTIIIVSIISPIPTPTIEINNTPETKNEAFKDIPTTTATPKIPGFGAIFTTGILLIVYLFKSKYKN